MISPERDAALGGLEAVYFENHAKLRGFLVRGVGDLADDLLQELWLKLQRNTIGPVADPRSYLFRMAYNLMLDARKRTSRADRQARSWSEAMGTTAVGVSDDPASDRILIARELLVRVNSLIDDLGEPTAMIFRQHRIAGKTQRLLAMELGMGLSTVEKHLRKAYRAIIAFVETGDEA